MAAPFAKTIREDFSDDEIKNELNKIRFPVDVAIYGSLNYFNFGAALRIGHNFLINQYHAIDCPSYYEKAAMTARPWERGRILQYANIEDFIEKNSNRNIISFERRWGMESKDIRSYQYPKDPILLFGSENFGVPDQLLSASKDIVSIPVYGLVTDFNIACAISIALYDWRTKYKE